MYIADRNNSLGGVAKLIGVTKHQRSNQLALVIEYFTESNLRTFLKHGLLNWNVRCKILQNIALGLAVVHLSNVIHCDLHSGNILCNSNELHTLNPVISDFGLSKVYNQTTSHSKGSYGIIPYMAPELLRGHPYTEESDVYALGMILWELSSGEPPFYDRSHNVNLMLDICYGVRPPIINGTPDLWVELMEKCWDANPANRPTAYEVWREVQKWNMNQFTTFDQFSREQSQSLLPKCHPRSVYTSRFIPSISVLEEYSKEKNLNIDQIDDAEWEKIVSTMLNYLLKIIYGNLIVTNQYYYDSCSWLRWHQNGNACK